MAGSGIIKFHFCPKKVFAQSRVQPGKSGAAKPQTENASHKFDTGPRKTKTRKKRGPSVRGRCPQRFFVGATFMLKVHKRLGAFPRKQDCNKPEKENIPKPQQQNGNTLKDNLGSKPSGPGNHVVLTQPTLNDRQDTGNTSGQGRQSTVHS